MLNRYGHVELQVRLQLLSSYNSNHLVYVLPNRYGRVELQVRLQLLPSAVFAAAALELSGATTATVFDIESAGA